jgi:hypothetical protein
MSWVRWALFLVHSGAGSHAAIRQAAFPINFVTGA